MAYTYVSALVRERAIDAVWETVDVSAMDINVVYSTYQKCYLTLSNPLYTADVYLDMDLVRASIPLTIPGSTIPEWLASLGNTALPTFSTAPAFTTETVLFRDAWQAGYDIEPASIGVPLDNEIPVGALPDLIMSQANIDYNFMYENALITVNGFIHNTSPGQDGLYIQDGMTTSRNMNDNQVGILSFEKVGQLQIVPITDEMIYNNPTTEPLGKYVYVNLGTNLDNLSLLFVLGGKLHCMDEAYTIIGEGLVRINMDVIPWAQIFFDAQNCLDFSSITWSKAPYNPNQISTQDLYSDAVIKAFLQLSQTFFVIVSCPQLYLLRHYTERTKLPGRWTCASGLQEFPLIGPMGRIIEFTPMWENTLFVLRGSSVYDKNYMFETAPWETQKSVAPVLYQGQPIEYPNTFLMELGYQQLSATGDNPLP
jgi:hypothetical protein